MHWLCLITCLCVVAHCDLHEERQRRDAKGTAGVSRKNPAIVTKDGNLQIQSALNHNISFQIDGSGDVDFGNLGSVKDILSKISNLQSELTSLKQKINDDACSKDNTGMLCGQNGICISTSKAASNQTGYKCVCTTGFSGTKCDKRIVTDPCQFVKCSNSGTCKSKDGEPVCQCTSNWFGPRCQLQRPSRCNMTFTHDSGIISSPGFPTAYPPNIECLYLIRVKPGMTVAIAFSAFTIEDSSNCAKDSLQVRDGARATDKLLLKKCGANQIQPLTSSGNEVYLRFKTDMTGQVGSGFSLSYYSRKSAICGDRITADSGTVVSKNWPLVYSQAATCIWVVDLPKGVRIEFQLTQLTISGSSSSCSSYLELHDGASDSSPMIGKYCSQTLPAKRITNNNQLYIKFVSDGSGSKFRLKFNTQCGENITGPTGNFQSPYFPNYYPHKKRCVWTITVPVGNVITLTFPTFDLEPDTNCFYDSITVRNGPDVTSPNIGRFCGSSTPTPITSSMNQLTVIFDTDGSDSFRGFNGTYRSAPGGCGGAITGNSGNISSPTNSIQYPHSIRCIWTITAADRTRSIQVQFTSFDLEAHTQCRYDYVMFRDGAFLSSPVLYNNTAGGRFCGTRKPPVVSSSGESLTLIFITDISIAGVGFSARWASVPRTTGCDVYMGTATGSIQSPNYPQDYPHRQNCKYAIVVPNGQQIALTFRDFAMEAHSQCNYDSLSIYDGGNTTSGMLGRFCGTNSPGRVVSTGNAFYLVFKSDASSSAKGFYANYTAASTHCGGTLHTPSGLIRSPNYPSPYRHNAECEWIISVMPGNTISLNITDLDIESHSRCIYDYLELRDGQNISANLITRVCGSTTVRRKFKSTSNKLYIKFRSDASQSGKGFELTYTSGCGGVFNDFKGIIQSPNYPQSYPANRVCNWTINGRMGDTVKLTMNDFRLESGSTCGYDSLTMYNGSNSNAPSLGKYCGSTTPPVITSTVSSMFITFVSDRSLTYRGFNATYEIIGCSGDLTSDPGNFSTPNYPRNYPHDHVCVWRITVASGSRIQLNFSNIDIESHVNCKYDHLAIWNGPDKLAPRVGMYCSQHAPFMVTSSSNTLYIEFKSDTSTSGIGFKANYRSITGGCGGLITAPSGIIQSPGFPVAYPTNTQCVWIIMVAVGHNVRLNFTNFVLEPSSTCSYDYVQVNDGLGNSTQLAKSCGTRNPGLVISTGNIMVVKLFSDVSLTHPGFRAVYSTGCGGKVNADVPGLVTSPNYPRSYPHNSNCVWVLRATPGRKITLTFTNLDVEPHASCNYDYVEVRQGDNSNSSLVGRYCGTSLPHAITSFGNTLYVRFVTDSSTTRPGFRAQYSSASSSCGGTLSALQGMFVSPLYPANTPANADCVWKIKVAPGSKITVSFLSFNLIQSTGCASSFVVIRDGLTSSSLQIGRRHCGTTTPSTVQSTRENLYIRFYANSASSVGFRAQFTAVCSNTITYTQGYIASPGYPAPYPHSTDCVWTIIIPSGRKISVTFNSLDLEEHASCNYDYVEARDGNQASSTRLGRYCGSTAPSPFSTTGNMLYLKFHSDYSSGGNGFKLYFDGGPSVPACGGTLTATKASQYIQSPNYPSNYPSSTTCIWVINAVNGHTIRFNFTDFSLELGVWVCIHDYVELRDGATAASRYMSRSCGTLPLSRRSWHSTGNSLYVKFVSDSSTNRKGFKASYKMDCGGRLTATTGVVIPPVSNGKYLANQNCVWQISLPTGVAVQLKFSFIDLQAKDAGAPNCTKDYVDIRNGIAADSPLLGRYCGNQIPATINSTNNQVSVTFVTDGTTQLRGFNLTYTRLVRGCGGVLTVNDAGSTAVLMSPNYPQNYPNSVECEWVLNVPSSNKIEFTFTNVDIEQHSSCRWDYIELRDGGAASSKLIGRYCGSRLPTPYKFITNGSQMYVKLRADASATAKGFRATWRIGCGRILSALTGTFTSPGYPNVYPANKDCKYLIHLPTNKQVQVNFNQFSIVQSNPCSDFLEVYDGGSMNATRVNRLCGSTLPSTFLSTTNMVLYRFYSDGSSSGNGFKASYRAVGSICGGRITTDVGTIQSPNFPAAYPRGRVCEWTINVRSGRSVALKFSTFQLQRSSGCTADYIEIRTGATATSPFLGKYCGGALPPAISNSTGNDMYIKFYSNRDSTQLQGFSASYTSYLAGCGGTLSGASGYFTSPNYPNKYPSVAECEWTITVPSGSIYINFTDFNVEAHSSCVYDYVDLRDGGSSSAVLIGKVCGRTGLGFNYTSAGRTLYVKFRSDSSVTSKGFMANWTNAGTGTPGCGGRLTAANGVVTSPAYPNAYLPNLNCIWIVEVLPGRFITAQLLDLDMESSSPCRDSITIRNGGSSSSPLVVSGCSMPSVRTFTTTGNRLFVKFTTDGSGGPNRGFKGIWNTTIPGCGGFSTASSGVITSPNYPNNYYNNMECEWKIQVPGSSDRIIIYFDEWNLEGGATCQFDYLEIRNGSDRSAVRIAKLCGPGLPTSVSSTGPSIYLRFKTDDSQGFKGFKLNYKTGCGGNIKSRSGVILSPNYPLAYPPSKDCEWKFNVTGHYSLQVSFPKFSLQPTTLNGVCSADFVDVRNGTTAASPLLGKYCGSSSVPMQKSGTNQMYIKFHSDASSNSYQGFRATYNAVCGGLITDTNGVISSTLQSTGKYHQAETCAWIIRFSPGQVINVAFTKFSLEYHANCNYDYLEIRDGDNPSAPLVGKFCGGISPPSFTSSGNTLYIKFVTDYSISYDGFSMTYSLAGPRCGGVLNSNTGTIKTPNYPSNYSANENCGWSITVPAGKRIELSINDFVLQQPIGNGCYDFLELNEGRFPSSPLLGRYCGTRYRSKVTTAGNNLYVRFRSNGNQQAKGFIATYRAVQGCGGLLNVTSGVQTIKTPNNPSNYPANTFCDWLLQGRQGYKIQLKFSNFRLPAADASGNCTSNYVIVRSRAVVGASYGTRRYCGVQNNKIPEYISDSNIIRILLNSTTPAQGFTATYKEAVCGGSYTAANGLITSPNYPSYYPLSIECIYKITVSSSSRISLYFRYFNIEAHTACQYDYLDVHDGNSETSPRVQNRRWCGASLPPTIVSTANNLWIHFKTDVSVQNSGFVFSYTSSPRGCGGQLSGSQGALTSPMYPVGYNDTYDCTWFITVASGRRIKLTFPNFHLPYASSCVTTDYVEVRNGGLRSSTLVGYYCGSIHPAQFISSSNKLYIRFKSTMRSLNYIGFQAFYDQQL